jgi:hypothetical protein
VRGAAGGTGDAGAVLRQLRESQKIKLSLLALRNMVQGAHSGLQASASVCLDQWGTPGAALHGCSRGRGPGQK